MPAARTLDDARSRVLRLTARMIAFIWLPLMVVQTITVYLARDPVAWVALAISVMLALAAAVLWRPWSQRIVAQSAAFLLIVYVSVSAGIIARGLQVRTTIACALLVVWGTLFFGRRGLAWTTSALLPLFGIAVYRVAVRGDVLIAADSTGLGGALRTVTFVVVGLVLCGLAVHAALHAYEAAIQSERDALHAQHAERLARAAAEQNAEVLQRRQLAAALAVGLAHDLNNAVQVTATNAALLLETASAPDREVAEEILRAAERAGRMVRNLQAFGRAVADDQSTFSAREAMGSLRIILRGYTPKTVTTSFTCASESRLTGDELRFSQVIINLVINAIDAMPEGGSLALDIADDGPSFCAVRVADTGGGIAPENRERIFEPYFTTKPQGSGGGLGLSMVSRIVSEMGGDISLETAVGRGTTFTVHWPRAIASEP